MGGGLCADQFGGRGSCRGGLRLLLRPVRADGRRLAAGSPGAAAAARAELRRALGRRASGACGQGAGAHGARALVRLRAPRLAGHADGGAACLRAADAFFGADGRGPAPALPAPASGRRCGSLAPPASQQLPRGHPPRQRPARVARRRHRRPPARPLARQGPRWRRRARRRPLPPEPRRAAHARDELWSSGLCGARARPGGGQDVDPARRLR
mmetsp:Transcript_28321/g.71267  ORF Transcript_28321/g.71267 Transcript_28321/m.71267 type:complete len:212 (+) Transcript_28321:296-931(+)